MFSGYGIYLDGVIVGIIAEGEFYLKADRALAEKYKKEGLYPFTYTGHKGRAHELLYMSVPEETMEDREAIRARVLESYAVSKRAGK
jgi:DNA transformation protein